MSLINEALKKAQQQRASKSADTPPPTGGTNPPISPVTRRKPPVPVVRVVLIITTMVLLVVVLGIYGLTSLFSPKPTTAVTQTKPPAISSPSAQKPSPDKSPQLQINKNPDTAPVSSKVTVDLSKPSSSKPESAEPEPPIAKAETTQTDTMPTETVKDAVKIDHIPPPEPEPARPNADVYKFLDDLHVSGIRASVNSPKVLMNGAVYQPGDTVNYELGLKLTAISASGLEFTDRSGVSYEKKF